LVVFIDISDIDDEAKYYALDADDHVVTATTAPAAPPPESGWRVLLKDNSVLIRLADFAKDTLIEGKGWNRVTGDQNELLRRLTDSDRCGWTYDPVKLEGYGRRGLERAMAHMDQLLAVLRAHGNKPLTVVVYPWPAQLIKGDRDSIQAGTWRAWCAKNGVQLIDLFPVFFAAGKPMDVVQADYIPWDNHFAEPGHAVVAQSFLERFVLGRERAKTATTTSTATP
jgi:hypothetical protein